MAFGWANCMKRRVPRLPFCEHDLEDDPSVPLMPVRTRKQLEMSWTKPQDIGLLRSANRMYLRMREKLTQQKIEQLNKDFTFVEENEGHMDLAAASPFKDKCHYVMRAMDSLVRLLQCVQCLNDKVDEILHGNTISWENYVILRDFITALLKHYNGEAFTDGVKYAWETFFESIWNILEESKMRQELAREREEIFKEIEEERRREEQEMANRRKGTKKF